VQLACWLSLEKMLEQLLIAWGLQCLVAFLAQSTMLRRLMHGAEHMCREQRRKLELVLHSCVIQPPHIKCSIVGDN